MGGGGGCIQGGGRPLGLGGIGGPPILGMGGGKLWGPPWPPGPACMPWKFLFSVGPELIQGGRFCFTQTAISHLRQFSTPTRVWNHVCLQLTGGGWLLLGPEARGAPPWVLECPPPDVGTGASPNSAIRDRYSLSIRALSWAD